MQPGEETKQGAEVEQLAGSELRWIADAYEQTQRVRIQTGERIRAVVQGRDGSGGLEIPAATDAAELLRMICSGEADGPIPLLGRIYRRNWEAERELVSGMRQALARHPAWPWLSAVKGVGPTLAAKLLARLDVRRAATPSAFWAYCGLATVKGIEYRCGVCGLTVSHPESYRVSGTHLRLGSKRACSGELVRARGSDSGVRVAQPRPARGQRSAYDQYAKKVCYLIGTSFLKAGGSYRDHYHNQKSRLELERSGWTAARRHLAALRKTEKLFLAHLWLVWREAVGLSVVQPYTARSGGEIIDPWSMVDADRKPSPPAVAAVAAAVAGGPARTRTPTRRDIRVTAAAGPR
jgi:hypothetical protein